MKNEITAKRLRELLDEKGITAKELADAAGLNKASISQYVNGTYAPSNISAGKIAAVFEVNPLWVMGFDVSKEMYPLKETAANRLAKYADEIERLAYDKQELCFQLIENVIKTMKGGD